MIPGVLGNSESAPNDSFYNGLLEAPHYTRPEVWSERQVPQALLSGHHANIERWRRDQRLLLTAQHRPDLLAQARLAGLLSTKDETVLSGAR
jgi:tRNA (guanine37-N1)-methyltransferase